MTFAFKFLYRIYRTISGVRYWGYRRFTRAGLTVLGGLFLAGILGPDTDNNVAYQGFTFLLLLLILAFCSSFFLKSGSDLSLSAMYFERSPVFEP